MTDAATAREKLLVAFAALSWPLYLNDFYLIALSGKREAIGLVWALDVIFYTLVPVTTMVILWKKGWLDCLKTGFARPRRLWLTIPGAALLALATHIVFTQGLDPWLIPLGCCRLCRGYPLPAGALAAMLVTIYAPLSAGLLEEVIFRGILTDLLKKYTTNPVAIVVVNAALFAAIHWCGGTGKLAATFMIGLIPAAIYLRTGNLWLPMLWHVFHDAIVFWLGWS
jgi:membrane protease YdiL (CAAX protease family)